MAPAARPPIAFDDDLRDRMAEHLTRHDRVELPLDGGRHAALATDVSDSMCQTLPDYMVPSQVVRLDRLPRNANGKVDRGALKREFVAGTGGTS